MDTVAHPRRTLELTVLSLEDLRVDRKLATQNLFVVVRAESINCHTTGLAVEGGGGNPSWNEKLLVDVAPHARCVTLEVKCKSSTSVKDVGVARIAISDFLGGAVPDHCLQFLSYSLRDWEGRRSGVLNFSVRMKSPEVCSCGFQVRGDNTSSGGVVIGIPVSWRNNYASRNV